MSIFNPWVILGFIFAIGASATTGYHKGRLSEENRQKLVIAQLNEEARVKEQALASAVNTTATQLVKVNNEAKVQIAKRDAAITAGTLKLRVPTKTVCPVSTAPDASPASGSDTGSAEIQPETSRAILAIGDEADTTVRKLNACLAIYNQVREMINTKGKP
jgi:hypothetical protein